MRKEKMGFDITTVKKSTQLQAMLDSNRVDYISGIVSDNQVIFPEDVSGDKYIAIQEISAIPFALYLNKKNQEATLLYKEKILKKIQLDAEIKH